jgi:hypothetical protein
VTGVIGRAVVLAIALVAPAHAQANWEIRVPERVEIAQGASSTLPITISVDRGFSVSKDGPVIIDVASEPGVTIKKRRLGRTDAVDPGADLPRFVIPVRADTFGDYTVKLRIRLWLCGGKVCRPLDVKRQAVVSVAAPPPPDPPSP